MLPGPTADVGGRSGSSGTALGVGRVVPCPLALTAMLHEHPESIYAECLVGQEDAAHPTADAPEQN